MDLYISFVQEKETKEYKFISGEGQAFDITKDSNLRFEFDIDYDVFIREGKVYIDNNLVDSRNYVLSEGSTVITFNDDYTKLLSTSEHTLKVSVDDGEIETKFTIEKSAIPEEKQNMDITDNTTNITYSPVSLNPKTGDLIFVFVGLFIFSILGSIIVIIKIRK